MLFFSVFFFRTLRARMATHFYRLVQFLLNICTPVLVKFLEKCAASTEGGKFVSLEHYLNKQRNLIEVLTKKYKAFPFCKLYPTEKEVCLSVLDISALCTLILNLNLFNISGDAENACQSIRNIRNQMQHKTSTTDVSDTEFTKCWKELEEAVLSLVSEISSPQYESEIKDKIKHALRSTLEVPITTVENWFSFTIAELRTELEEMRDVISKIQGNTEKIKENTTVVRNTIDVAVKKDLSGNLEN